MRNAAVTLSLITLIPYSDMTFFFWNPTMTQTERPLN